MKKFFSTAVLLLGLTFMSLTAQNELLTDGGFEAMKPGVQNYVLNNSGASKITGFSGKWFLTFAKGGCPEGCCEGNSEITTSAAHSGLNALKLLINRQTNRNDIKLFQTMKAVPAGLYVISFWAKCDVQGTPLSLDILKATQSATNNGASPYTSAFTLTSEWKQYTYKVDISSWTDEERNDMRVSLRPNCINKLPEGPFPKIFWIDDVSFLSLK